MTTSILRSNDPTDRYLPKAAFPHLPDLLRPNLRLVFVGTAASTRSAELGHYYAHPGNRFWRAIHEAGITPRRYQPSEFASLIVLGIGFTDLCKTGAGMDHQIAAEAIDVAGFRAKMDKYRPRTIAFTSKKAASLFYGRPSRGIALGRQVREASLPEIFVLPSPSGAASGSWTIRPWRELSAWISS
ncbi:mismatch-specific DNA-glycosylase [Bradyrhizobium sp. WBOS7]|nr:mismatch-specific DNA-glycosylase [Bradyrhizobium sp. WBOS2]MDD1574494.1 mismatch-specific DNA-glycosylase [Bradyrhizobium sp. WBOS1]MDD1580530.1 mismatch-specific DNA-glycosylase [Bradyrhizobium sp. WBOS7]UUO35542.1 mismatch-specific DNA-glycosylase [Bradyrhizobium sp. WBOS01]UUO41851.1 mismatch-specific DNA-glycosylase [Bradyrhizobium sp. WBOS02]UUO56188.1 mismatch-specific DNA-glycosylase [Bradyrhizobium sp. WBOS07]